MSKEIRLEEQTEDFNLMMSGLPQKVMIYDAKEGKKRTFKVKLEETCCENKQDSSNKNYRED